jgi:penicillin-binding protein 1A
MPLFRRFLRWAIVLSLALAVVAAIGLGVLYRSVSAKLPDVSSLRSVEMQEPLYVYSSDGRLIGLFGETRRYPVSIAEVPQQVKEAFVSAEDASFYQHKGIDPTGISRAVWQTLTKEGRVAGGSTITQQVARQFFLSSEYSYTRKLAEMMLALRIEKMLSKDEILELYLNKSFFGNRSYGIAAAAEYYYGKPLKELSLLETATLVSTVKFPSSGNPISNPQRNQQRSGYVIDRMVEEGYVAPQVAAAAKTEQMHATPHERPVEVYAPYMAEMVRQEMIARFGGDVLTKGYHVTTTVNGEMQAAADKAVRDGLNLYDHRHGWRGVEDHFDIGTETDPPAIAKFLRGTVAQGGLIPTVMLKAEPDGGATVIAADGRTIVLPASASKWIGRTPAKLFQPGDLVRLRFNDKQAYEVDQVPRAQSAVVSLDASTGAIRAIIGGYSFAANKFNRATQARRQPGSSFKPFLYSAAFDRGFNPASIVLDAPVVFRDRRGHMWRPQNDGGGFAGPMRLREALVKSKNLVSVRLLDSIGVDYARKYISQLGFNESELPPNLSMSLGTASLTPLSIARGYATFVNGGSLVTPWFIDEVKDRQGNVIYKEKPATACRACVGTSGQSGPANNVVDGFNFGPAEAAQAAAQPKAEEQPNVAEAPPADVVNAPRAIDPRTAYQLVSMMRDVVQRGTGTAAKVLAREDIGGKTGSTNDHRDAWFSGFGGNIVTTVWVGRDDFRSLGYREYGGKAALPIWIDYMRVALKDQPIATNEPPEGMVQATLNGATEWVKVEDLDKLQSEDLYGPEDSAGNEAAFDIF